MIERLNPMPMVDPVHRFILFTNPKCGGTTLKAWFFDNLGLGSLHRRPAHLLWVYGPRFFVRYWQYGRPLAVKVPCSSGTSEYTDDYKAALRNFIKFYRRAFCARVMRSSGSADYFRICVVRNPYDRVVSGYLDKFCSEGRYGREAPYVQRMLCELGRSQLTFRQFLAYLRSVDEDVCASHWRRQTYILEGQRVDAFVRLEALHDEMARHAQVVGTKHLPLLHMKLQATRIGTDHGTSVLDMTDVPSLQIAAQRRSSGSFPPRASFLTPEMREQIREIYALDFKRLPYDP